VSHTLITESLYSEEYSFTITFLQQYVNGMACWLIVRRLQQQTLWLSL